MARWNKIASVWMLAGLLGVFGFLSSPSAQGALPGWHTNYATAVAQAKANGKLLLVHFSGSDWCGWCMKLQKDVFQKKEFQEYAATNLVLLSVDFPKRKPMAPAMQEFNQALAARFQIEGIPTIVVANEDGSKLGVLGFSDGGPKTFIKELERFVAQRKSGHYSEPSALVAKVRPVLHGGLELQQIVGKKDRRSALINNQSLTAGQSAKVRVASGEVSIRCMEIRDESVIVKVEGRREPLELKLAQRL